MRTRKIGEMKKLKAGRQGDISLAPDLESLVDCLFVLLRQGHEALARRLGRSPDTDGSGLGRYLRPVLLGLQKKGWYLRPARFPSSPGERGTVTLGRPDAFDAAHSFVEMAVLQQVHRGNSRSRVNGEQQAAGADPITPVEVAESRQHPPDCSIVPGGYGFAIRPVMDTSTRNVEQVAEFLPGQARPAPDFHNRLGGRFRGHIVELPNRTRDGALGTRRDARSAVRFWKRSRSRARRTTGSR